jgi:hypothetical protein
MYDSKLRTMIPEAGRTLEMLNLQVVGSPRTSQELL